MATVHIIIVTLIISPRRRHRILMMTIKLTLEIRNADTAYGNDWVVEVAEVCDDVAQRVPEGALHGLEAA